MKRILFVIESLFPLGPAHQLLKLVRELTERSYEIQIAVVENREVPDWTAGLQCKVIPLSQTSQGCGAAADFGRVPAGKSGHPISRTNFQSIRRLRNVIHQTRPDVVHAWCGSSALISLVASQFPKSGSASRPKLFNTELYLQPEKRFTQHWYEDHISPGFNTTIVPHESAKNHLIKNGFNGPIEIVSNRGPSLLGSDRAFDREVARQQLKSKLKLPPDAKIAGTVAPLIARTRLKDLIWATDLLACIRDDFHFVILGNGVQESRLRRFVSLTEAQSHVHFLGEPADARECLAGLDFYWHSHLIEPSPAGLLTAMELGIPAISVYGPGIREIIRHQETGFAVNFGARDEFARWTKFLIEKVEPARQLATQGQSFVRKHFGESSQADDYLRIWDRL